MENMSMESFPIVFINCSLFPFVDWIIKGKKLYETRNRNTLKSLVGKRVYIAETGKGKKPIVLCAATIGSVLVVDNKKQYNSLRKQTRIKTGSVFDWNTNTKRKYLYKLVNVDPVTSFIPAEGIRHGRTWMEFNGILTAV